MNWDIIQIRIYNKIDFVSESKLMHNRYWVHRAYGLIRKIENHQKYLLHKKSFKIK